MIVYFNAKEFLAYDDDRDGKAIEAKFFATRKISDFTRVGVGDFAYVRAIAVKFPGTGGNAFGEPRIAVTTNISDLTPL